MTRHLLEQRLRAGEVPAKARQSLIERFFQEVGCQVALEPVNKHASNVICNLPGKTEDVVVVGAHFDFADEGKGIVDDWTGASMLVSLFESLNAMHPSHTFQFVAFAAEERGLLGSTRYVKELTKEQRDRTKAFVNLECLGLTAPKVWVHRSTPLLVEHLSDSAKALHLSVRAFNVDALGDDDTRPFLPKKIPVISIHSVSQETWGILHSSRDNMKAIKLDDYYDTYRLISFYLERLDAKLSDDVSALQAETGRKSNRN